MGRGGGGFEEREVTMKLPLGDFLFGMWNYLWWSVEYVRFWKTFCTLLGLFFH